MFDVIVRNGLVVDGSDATARKADVAVAGGVIQAVGEVQGEARRVIDATDCWVTPGFIDPHTHLDAQLCWDGSAAPSNLHGFTSVVIGLCGFGVAPCPADGSEYLLRSLERVEEIPYASTRLGVPFAWEHWSDYFEFIGRQRLGVNVAGFVPHSALRYHAMGERARGDTATEADRHAMVRELQRAYDVGALGFASSRGPNHVDGFGQPVPSRFADDAELQALVSASPGRLWQMNVRTKFGHTADELNAEVGAYAAWSQTAGARFTWSPFHAETTNHIWPDVLDRNRELNAAGTVVLPQISALPIGVLLRFDEPSFFARIGGWEPVLGDFFSLEPAARKARLLDPSVRERLKASDPNATFAPRFHEWTIAASPTRPHDGGRTIDELATAAGAHPVDLLCDLVVADDLRTLLLMSVANRDPAGVRRLLDDDLMLLALGDAGAHVMSVTNYRYSTYLLSELVMRQGSLGLERAVALMTSRPARVLGFTDRGALRVGAAADVCVIDPERLGCGPVEVAHDQPGNAPRLYQGARGYRAVLVNGELTVDDDRATDARSGGLLRV